MSLTALSQAAQPHALQIMGALHDQDDGTIALLGPQNPDFWPLFQTSPEFSDGAADPLNRWSTRVISGIAQDLQAEPLFPFGGPPWHPFLTWAVDSGSAWASPVGMLVHATEGLMVSYRGALRFGETLDMGRKPTSPCTPCDAPCTTACPVGALTPKGYDTEACRAYLRKPDGADCLHGGCQVRRTCPVSQTSGRDPAQSAFHMQAFLNSV